jgi:molybdopterin-guanine dinucleotide biosynthesis protein A
VVPYAAVVLTGGTATRMDGADKAALEYAGRTLLETALASLVDASEIIVVGPACPTSRPVTFVREDPPLGGPAAGLLAGLDALQGAPDLVVVLAVDMPLVSERTVARLVAAADTHDGAMLVDRSGRRQLAGVLRPQALDRRRPAPGADSGLPFHRLLAGLDLAEVASDLDEARDVDTWRDFEDLPG